MAKRYTAEFSDLNGTDYRLDFYDSEHIGDPDGTLTLGVPGFTLQWDGSAENTHEPILSSACSIPVYSQTTEEEAFIADIQSGQEGRFRVEIWKGPAASARMFWSGVLFSDLTLEDELPSLVTLEATDDLGLLDEVLFKSTPSAEYTDTTHLIDIFCRCLGKVRHIDAWDNSTNFLQVVDYVQHEDMSGAPYTRKIIINTTKLRNIDEDGQPQYHTCTEVLTNMLQNIQCRLMQYDGHFWVIPVGGMGAGMISRPYYKTGDNGNTTDVRGWFTNIPSTNTFALGNLLTTASRQKLTGWQFSQLPSLSEVVYRHDYDGHAYDWNSLVPSTNFGSSFWFANSAPVIENGDVVSLTFSYYISFLGYGSAVGSRGRRLRIGFKYKHGDVYGKRFVNVMTDSASNVVTNQYSTQGTNVECFAYENQAPGWSLTTSNEVQEYTAVFDRYTGATLTGTTTIVFPPITGTPGVTQVGYFTLTCLDEDGNEDTNGPTYATAGLTSLYQMRGAATYDGDTITFRRANQDTDARESLELEPAILADKIGENSNPESGLWLINDGGAYVKPTEGWTNTNHSTASTTICDLAALDILSMRLTPMEKAVGTFEADYYGPLISVQGLDGGSDYWLPLRLTFDAESRQYNGEWVKYQFDTTTTTDNDDNGSTVPGIAGMPAIGPRRNRVTLGTLAEALSTQTQRVLGEVSSVMSEQADTAVDFGNRLRAIETDGKQSSIELVQLGDVNTSTLTQGDVLEWDATAEEWVNAQPSGGGADNSLSETDQTIAGGTTRKIVLDGAGASIARLDVEDGEGNTLKSVQSYGNGVSIQETYGIQAFRSTSLVQGQLSLYEAASNGVNSVSLRAPAATTANLTFILPDGYGTNGQQLTTNGTGGLTWADAAPGYSYHVLTSSFYSADGNGDYIPVGGTLSETTSSNYYTIFTAPLDGEVVKATCIVSATTAGSTTLRIRKYPVPTWIDSDTQTFSSTLTTGTFTFDTATFSAGDRLQFWFDPTGRPNGVQLSILIKFTHP